MEEPTATPLHGILLAELGIVRYTGRYHWLGGVPLQVLHLGDIPRQVVEIKSIREENEALLTQQYWPSVQTIRGPASPAPEQEQEQRQLELYPVPGQEHMSWRVGSAVLEAWEERGEPRKDGQRSGCEPF
jgi:hypothetical protein